MADDWATVYDTVANTEVLLLPEVREAWEPARRIVFNRSVLKPRYGYRIEVTGLWGFPAVPGNVRQAVLDAIGSIVDSNVTHWQTDLGPTASGEGTNVVVMPGRTQVLSLPPTSQAVAEDYRYSSVA